MAEETVTLEKHFELQIKALEQRLIDLREADRTAISKAEASIDKRLDGMNEFRQQLKDQQATYVTNPEFSQFQKAIYERLDRLTIAVNELETYKAVVTGKASVPTAMLSIGLGIIALILGIANVVGLLGAP